MKFCFKSSYLHIIWNLLVSTLFNKLSADHIHMFPSRGLQKVSEVELFRNFLTNQKM